MAKTSDMSLGFYAVHIESREIYEIRPFGAYLLVRPARFGHEKDLARIDFLDFDSSFNPFLAKFLIPNQLREEDFMEVIE